LSIKNAIISNFSVLLGYIVGLKRIMNISHALIILICINIAFIALVIAACYVVGRKLSQYVPDLIKNKILESISLTDHQHKELFNATSSQLKESVDTRVKLIEEHKEQIFNVVKDMRLEISKSNITSERLNATIAEHSKATGQHHKTTKELQDATNKLKDILSNNQGRGLFGQEIAEDLMKMAGFVNGQNYVLQRQQEDNSRPDITLLLPDQARLNIDVKFPFQALQRLRGTDDQALQKQYEHEFGADIKSKLRSVTKYIQPEEKTLDFVVLFIPNEMIFSYICDKFPDICKDALEKKIVMCGPFGFTATLRMIKQSYDNFRYNSNMRKIITYINSFKKEIDTTKEEMEALGKKILHVSSAYDQVVGVRMRKLESIMAKIESADRSVD